jgi:hypothetical protein
LAWLRGERGLVGRYAISRNRTRSLGPTERRDGRTCGCLMCVMWRAVAGRCHVDLAWIGLGIGDELGNRGGRDRWIHLHDKWIAADARDRCDVTNEIEAEPVVECRVSRKISWGKRGRERRARIKIRGLEKRQVVIGLRPYPRIATRLSLVQNESAPTTGALPNFIRSGLRQRPWSA